MRQFYEKYFLENDSFFQKNIMTETNRMIICLILQQPRLKKRSIIMVVNVLLVGLLIQSAKYILQILFVQFQSSIIIYIQKVQSSIDTVAFINLLFIFVVFVFYSLFSYYFYIEQGKARCLIVKQVRQDLYFDNYLLIWNIACINMCFSFLILYK